MLQSSVSAHFYTATFKEAGADDQVARVCSAEQEQQNTFISALQHLRLQKYMRFMHSGI